MFAYPSSPSIAFPRLTQGHEATARPQPDAPIPPPRNSANSAPSAFSPETTILERAQAFEHPESPLRGPNFETDSHPTSHIPHPTSDLPAFSDWLEHEFTDPQRDRLLRRATSRANPSDLTIERDHERDWNYKDRGTLPPRANLPLFDPSSEEAEVILREIADPGITYADIARRHNTTFEALCLWLARPAIAERYRTMSSAAARRAHFVVADNLANIAQILVNTLRSSSDAHEHSGYLPKTTRGFIAHLRSREDIRKSANLLLRIARFDFHPNRPERAWNEVTGTLAPEHPNAHESVSEAPSLREGVGGRQDSETFDSSPGTLSNPSRPERARDDETGAVAFAHPAGPESRSASEAPSPMAVRTGEREDIAPSAPRSTLPAPDHAHIRHPPFHIQHPSPNTG